MIRHLLKLVWHRKRSTALLMLEIAVSFVVVFLVTLFALRYAMSWRTPIGFDWRNAWVVAIDTNVPTDDEWSSEDATRLRQLLAEARTLPRVESAAAALLAPYEIGGSYGMASFENRSTRVAVDETTDDFADTLGLHLVAGRFFGRADDGATIPPVVMNRRLAAALFGDGDALGQVIHRGQRSFRVVGIVDEFRPFGELWSGDNWLFQRVTLANADERPPRRLVLRMAPGTTAGYEPALLARLAPLASGWSLSIQPMSAMRHSQLRLQMAPLLVGGVVAGFLLLMVGLGLLGVLWQNVTRRTRELGLRRAAGASRAAVHRQVLLELALVTTLAVIPALALVVQLPMISLLDDLSASTVAAASGIALAVIFALTLSCGVYPSRVATRLEPADALRWE
jgi:putative ABC transport system permease protein